MFVNSVIFLIIWGFTLTVGQLQGESCLAERTNSEGICKLINKCPSVIHDIRNRLSHTKCGFQGRLEIVCCPVENRTESSPKTCSATKDDRLHVQKCREYQLAVYDYEYTVEFSVGTENRRVAIDKCGHKQVPLIIGTTFANLTEFPHMALVGFIGDGNYDTQWLCGGTLISERYVLTAAHCVLTRQYGEPKVVRLGELVINSNNDDAQPEDYKIEKVISHPDWKTPERYNDIGLMKLDRKANFSPYIRPACLPIHFDDPGIRNIATGWGKTESAGSFSKALKKIILEKFSHSVCNEAYANVDNRGFKDGIRDETQLCTGSELDKTDTCQGDSGGPLQVYHHCEYCMYTVIGITSFGLTCGSKAVPGIYTRVFPYVDWIENIVWKS